MATKHQLHEALAKAYKQARSTGDLSTVKRLEEAINTGLYSDEQQEAPPTLASVGRGAVDMWEGANQLARRAFAPESAEAYEQSVQPDREQYAQGVAPGSFDGGRLGGQVAGGILAAAPAMLLPGGQGAGAMMVRGALEGLLGSASNYVEDTDNYWGNKAIETGIGTVVGGAAPIAIKAVTKPATKAAVLVKDKLAQLTRKFSDSTQDRAAQAIAEAASKFTNYSDEMSQQFQAGMADDIARQLDATGDFDPVMAARRANMEQQGFRGDAAPTLAQITRNPKQWQVERNLAQQPNDVGAAITGRLDNQRRQAQTKALELADIIGPESSDYATGSLVRDVAQDFSKSSQKQVSGDYTDAAKLFTADDMVANPDRLFSGITEVYDAYSDAIPSAIKKRVAQLVDGDLTPNVENIDKAVKLINKRKPDTPDAQAGLAAIRHVLNQSLDETAEAGGPGAEALRSASAQAARRFNMLSSGTREKTVKNLISDTVNTEKLVKQKIMAGDVDDLAHLKRFLTSFDETFTGVNRADGKEAWNAVRSSVIRNINKTAGADDAGEMAFSGRAWEKAFDKLGDRREILFTPEENTLIDAAVKAAKDISYEPPFTMSNKSGTAAGNYQILSKVGQLPGFRAMTDLMIGGLEAGKSALKSNADFKAGDMALRGVQSSTRPERALKLEDLILNKLTPLPAASGTAASQLPPWMRNER